jgi:hypothetical protein
MHIDRRRFVGAALAVSVAACTTRSVAPPQVAAPEPLPTSPEPEPEPAPTTAERAMLPPLVAEALAALDAHAGRIVHRDRIGVADFSVHSSEPRFHLVDVASGRIERSWLVAHGSGSDPAHSGMLQQFSNRPGSNATSRGAYLTAHCYHGKYGRSQRLIGLDPDNDMALDRAIVVHGAPYVDPSLIAAQGRIGRSQGCFAFELAEVATVMDLLGEGRMIYASKLA